MRPLNRIMPKTPVEGMISYRVTSPINTHTRPATCTEVGCEPHLKGWTTLLPTGSEQESLLLRAAEGRVDGIRRRYTRSFDGKLTAYRFPAGQSCFRASAHRVSLDRPEIYLVRGGDWRANTGLIRRHTSADSWVDDFSSHQDKIKRQAFG